MGSTPNDLLDGLRSIVTAQLQAGMGWLRERRLSPQQAFVLNFLEHNPGAIQREIATASRTTDANVSGVIRGLEARGLVARRSDDDRSKRVYATDEGIGLVCGHEQAMAAADERILAPLTTAERLQLTRLLDKVVAGLPPHLDPAPHDD